MGYLPFHATMNDLKTSLENLYTTFSQYTTEKMQYCDCGCIDEKDVKKLNSKKLRDLEEDDLVSYHGSALYTWGDVAEYKHYLPRIFELRSLNRNFAFIELDEIFIKLDYAKWTVWNSDEIQAIREHVLADWIQFSNNEQSEINDVELEAYGMFIGKDELFRLWDIGGSHIALKNFVLFFYYYGNIILHGRSSLINEEHIEELISLIHSDKIIAKLEEDFFEYENTDKDYAEKASIVLQMIEQSIKIERSR